MLMTTFELKPNVYFTFNALFDVPQSIYDIKLSLKKY